MAYHAVRDIVHLGSTHHTDDELNDSFPLKNSITLESSFAVQIVKNKNFHLIQRALIGIWNHCPKHLD